MDDDQASDKAMTAQQARPGGDAHNRVPDDPEERAFTGHPDHPPATPDQPVEGNQELLRQGEEEAGER